MSNVHDLFYRKSNGETGQLRFRDMSRKTKVKVKVRIQLIGLVRVLLLEMSQNLSFSVKPCSYTVEEEVSQWPLGWSQFI